MERGNVDASLKGVLVPVPDTSDVFENRILAPLQSAYLYEESRQCFRYKSAVFIENVLLEEKYNAFRAKRRRDGYSEEDLKETYGFLLFDDTNKAHALGETGVLTGNGTCTTLGDPLKGVYISMYSDCLDPNYWYHGKSGYIVIVRLTKGRVKRVSENYTQTFTPPTVGFDCHISEALPSVSAKTSSFLAFERTQYYIYELLDGGSCKTAKSPSAACPFAIVSFSYTDTKAILHAPHKISRVEELDFHYLSWMGQLQIGTQFIDVGLRTAAVALIPVKLPPVVKVDRAISMLDLLRLMPRAAFETCSSGEVFLGGFYFSLCELVPSEAEESKSLSLLLQKIKEKDLALPVSLNDGGFLILLHSSHFLMFDGSGSKAPETMQALFMFPASRCVHRGTQSGQGKGTLSSEILQVLPALNYAEREVEKTCCDSTEELCEVLSKHMQSYAALINPGLELSPRREVGVFPDQYDILPDHTHLYSSPEWTNKAWHRLRSYVTKPASFQLPLTKASDILAVEQDEQRYDLDDDVYIRLPSLEEAQTTSVCIGSEDQVTDQIPSANHETSTDVSHRSEDQFTSQKTVTVETSVDSCMTSSEARVDLPAGPQNVKLDDFPTKDATSDTENWTVLDMGTKDPLTSSTSDDLPAELIVSITSAEQSVTDKSLNLISNLSTMKHDEFQISCVSEAKLQTTESMCLHEDSVNIKSKDSPKVTGLLDTKQRKLRGGASKGLKGEHKAFFETLTLRPVKKTGKDSISVRQKDEQAKELISPSNTHWKKLRKQKWKFGKLSSNNKNVRCASVGLGVAKKRKSDFEHHSLEGSLLMEHEMCPPRKKIEHWDLRPLVSECGRILVPHGSVDTADQIQSLKDWLQCKNEDHNPEKKIVDATVNAHEVKIKKAPSTETAVEDPETITFKNVEAHPENALSLNKEHILVTPSDNGSLHLSPEHFSKNNMDCPLSEVLKKKKTDALSPGKKSSKGTFLLNKLKSVLLRGKRKNSMTERPKGSADKTEPCLKKGKGGSDAEAVKVNEDVLSVQDNVVVTGVSDMLSVDPLFAYALGLAPIEKPEVQKSEGQQRDSSETKRNSIVGKEPRIVSRSPLVFQRRGKMKTLKKHQGVSAECVKKTWWLHFQTPACLDTENLKCKELTEDSSAMKTFMENVNSTCSSTDALNLLADLALCASKDLVPPQSTFERKPETSMKTCKLTKDAASTEQESLLRALLRQPAARPIQPLDSSSSPLVGDSEMVDVISKEHNYSLPPSASLVLGLPDTPFQVSPLSGSTRLLHHYQPLNGDGTETVPPSIRQDGGECNHYTQKYLKKHSVCKKFRHSRSFVSKDKSVQVTRQWKENYDFIGDSQYANDPKGKGVMRSLHGPWDASIQDTPEDARLILHMWIGLFYSRSTPRFFHLGSDFTNSCPEESGSLEMSSRMVSAPAKSELHRNAISSTATQDNAVSNELCLSKKDVILEEESMVLDLSLRNSNEEAVPSDPQINQERPHVFGEQKEASETLTTLEPSLRLQDISTLQYCSREHTAETADETQDRGSHYEDDETCVPYQKPGGCLEGTGMPSCKEFIVPQGESVLNWTGNDPTAPDVGHMLPGCSKEKMCVTGVTVISQTTEMTLVETHLSKHDKEKEPITGSEVIEHTDENHESQAKDVLNCQVKENPCQECKTEPSPKMNYPGDATNKDSSCIDWNRFGSKTCSKEEPTATPAQPENNVDFCSVHERKLFSGDEFGRNELDEKDICSSAMETGNDQDNQPLPAVHVSPDSVEKGSSTDCSCQTLIREQPPHAEDSCPDLNLSKSPLTDKHVISEEAPHTPYGTESVNKETAVEKSSENEHCLNDEEQHQEVSIPIADESHSSLVGSRVTESFLQKKDTLETGNKNTVMQVNSGLGCEDHEVKTKLVVIKGTDDSPSQEKSFHCHFPSPQYVIKEFVSTKETSNQMDKTKVGIKSQGKSEDVFQSQKVIAFICDPIYPNLLTEVGNTPDLCSRGGKFNSDRISPLDVSEIKQQVVFGGQSDERCPTPTLDEKPLESIHCHKSDGNVAIINENTKHISISSELTEDKMLAKQTLCQKPRFDYDQNSHCSHDPDLEVRTLRVLQSIGGLLSSSDHINNSCQVEVANIKNDLDQNPDLKPTPIGLVDSSHTLGNSKNNKIGYLKPSVVSASNSQELHRDSSDQFISEPYRTNFEKVLGLKSQLDKMDMCVPQYSFERTDKLQGSSTEPDISHSCRSSTSKCLQAKKASVPDMYRPSNPESFSYTRRPVVAVKPSLSKADQADCSLKDGYSKYPEGTNTVPTTELLERSDISMGNSEPPDTRQESNTSSSRGSYPSNIHIKASLDEAKFALPDPSYHCQKNTILSSLAMQSLGLTKNGHSFLKGSLLENEGKTSKDISEMKVKKCSTASTDGNSATVDSLVQEPQTSLICTVFNTNQKRSPSFLEQVSKRCLQDDLTQASIEQEHLIFSEKIKQLLKRKKRTTVQQDAYDHLNSSCASPLTVHFSSLGQEDSLDLIDAPSLPGQNIKVHISNKTDMAVSKKERILSPEKGNLKEYGDISGVTIKCARSYEAMMDKVCATKKAPSTPKHFRNNKNVQLSNDFYCGQVKRRMDESFQSNLNSVVKKTQKTQKRFYILETSDDDLFKKTKAQMESEGHTAIQLSDFFHGENCSSSLLIILRNEDIAAHASKVPYLLELKRTPGVQFAGIDEPDDIVNLTHQELFTQGGFIMFDRAALEAISLCNMEKCSEILHELSKTGKWKWMVHYRDSRRLKENARLSSEAKEKQCFLNSCQDSGILEVLPYHDCDAMSRHQPDYLTCLVRLQIHNISARYPVFITDTATDAAFGRNGIFTLTVNSFLTKSSSETFLL